MRNESITFKRVCQYLNVEFAELAGNIDELIEQKRPGCLAYPEEWAKEYYQEFITGFMSELYHVSHESPGAAMAAVIRAKAIHKGFAQLMSEMEGSLFDLFEAEEPTPKKRKRKKRTKRNTETE